MKVTENMCSLLCHDCLRDLVLDGGEEWGWKLEKA